MSYNNNPYYNPYYHPENFQLEIVGEIETEESYEFDKFVVWKNKNGEFFYAIDAGCSCPSPFENFDSEADLTRIEPNRFADFELEVMSFAKDYSPPTMDDRMKLIQKIKGMMFL